MQYMYIEITLGYVLPQVFNLGLYIYIYMFNMFHK